MMFSSIGTIFFFKFQTVLSFLCKDCSGLINWRSLPIGILKLVLCKKDNKTTIVNFLLAHCYIEPICVKNDLLNISTFPLQDFMMSKISSSIRIWSRQSWDITSSLVDTKGASWCFTYTPSRRGKCSKI